MLNMYLNSLFYLIFEDISIFKEEVYKEGYASSYSVDHMNVDDYYILSFNADSNYADLFKDTIDKYLKNIKVSEEELNRVKKMSIASEIRSSDNVNRISRDLSNRFINYNKVYVDSIKYVKKMNINELNKIIRSISFDNNTFVLMLPKND